ncbi:MAG: PD40 domain-containing protein [Saprospiraceae bacterium]|nr:PD40 domain-containing protein [Saprospiraceae bacterium]
MLYLFFTQTNAQNPPQLAIDSVNGNGNGAELLNVNPPTDCSLLSPCRYGDRLYFTTVVPTKTGQITRIYSTVGNDAAQPLPINPKEDQLSIANMVFNTAATRIYYTLSREPKPGNAAHSELWYCDKTFDGKWGKSERLSGQINLPGTSAKEPAIGFDFKLRKEVLFFASDRPGGKGGYDIWYSPIEPDGRFGEPVNFPFNSSANDGAPHFFTQQQILFYSSNSLAGLGGYDIYQAERSENGEWLSTQNLQQINTPFDEGYFFYHPQSQTTYFCSNRPNGKCKGDISPCTDYSIYSANMGGSLVLNIINEKDSTALLGCNIELEDTSTGQFEQTILKSASNTLQMPIHADKRYRLIVSKEGFFPVFMEMQTTVSNCFKTLTQKVVLKPMR